MPGPSTPATFQRPDLGQAYLEFDIMSHLQGFVGLNAMPMTTVGLQASNFSKVSLAQLLNDDRKVKRASGAGYARQDLQFDQDSYSTDERGVEELLDDRDRAIFAYTGIQFEQLAADRAVAALLRNLEVEIAGILTDIGTYANSAVTVPWATKATATPASDVLAARETFKLACGVYPNTITMSEKAATNVVQTAEMQDFIKYTSQSTAGDLLGAAGPGNGVIAKTAAILAMAFRIDNVNISPAISNSANSGAAPVLADIWRSDRVSLSLTPQGGDLRSMGFGRTFAFEQMILEQYRDERVRGDVMRARFDVDVKVIQAACLHILTNT
jgi:hypothetical protein